MKSLIIIIFILTANFATAQNTHVLFGERTLTPSGNISICFDKEGSIYPDYYISNASLEKSNNSLKEYYLKNQSEFIKIGKKYNCIFKEYNEANNNILNDSIAVNFTKKINFEVISGTSVTFLIHGFRKAFIVGTRDIPSPIDFQTMKQALTDNSLSKTLFVEIYWDALYGCCFSKDTKQNEILFKLFEEAQVNAEQVGKGFKTILSSINCDTINIITHSLGAKVAAYAVLDIYKDLKPTPSCKRLNICLVAPAISAQLISDNYYKRNSKSDFNNQDNYNLIIIYNEDDFVLKKKDNVMGLFGPGPYKYGNTTLGCNYHNTAVNLKKKFKSDFAKSTINLIDLSSVGKCHHVRCYFYGENIKSALKLFH